MPQTSFKVTIKGMSAKDLPALDTGGTSDPFVKVNFDNFKTYSTAVQFKNLTPVWDEEVSFVYTTKFADCMSRKSVTFEVFDHNRFSSNELIGTCKVDLHTIATGCVTHELPVRDGRKTRGSLRVDIIMEQTSSIEVRQVNMGLKVAPNAMGSLKGLPSLELACALPAGPATEKIGAQATSTGAKGPEELVTAGWPHPDVLYAEGTLVQIAALGLVYTLKGAGGKALASGTLPLKDCYSFVEGEAVEFSLPLAPAEGSPVRPGEAVVKGALIFSAFPVFTQMSGGLHTEAGIKGATYPFPDVPFRPRCAVTDEGGKEIEAYRVSAQGEKDKAAAKAAAGGSPAKPAAPGGGAGGGAGAGGPAPPPANRPIQPEDLSKPRYKPGNAAGLNPPAVTERLFGGAPGLPVCWVRREDGAGKVVFENLATGGLEGELPKDNEYVVTLPAVAEPGPLGMQLEPNFSGSQRFGFRSGRRNSGYDLGAVVRGLKAESPLQAAGKLRPGHHLIAINGASTLKMTFEATVAALRQASRPLILRFHDPYAVPADLVVQAKKANLTAKQCAHFSAGRSVYTGGKPGGGKPGSGPGAPGGKPAYSKAVMADAQRTLDTALDMLAKVKGQTGADGKPTDPALARALGDAALLRTLTAAITGTAGDAAPAEVRERLEAEAKERADAAKKAAQAELEEQMAAGPGWSGRKGVQEEKKGEEEEDGDGDEPTPLAATAKALTTDGTATRALKVVAAIAGSSAAASNRMAELGVFARSVAAVAARPSAAVAESAIAAVSTAAPVLAKAMGGALASGVKALGLGGPSLIVLQTAARRHEFVPEMTEKTTAVVSALALDNPDQDGLGFLALVAKAVTEMAGLAKSGYQRALAPDGNTFYITPTGESVWDPPKPLFDAFSVLKAMDRRARVIEDTAIVSASETRVTVVGADGVTKTVPLTVALPMTLTAFVEDSYVCAALLGAAAKLASLPNNALALLTGNMLKAADAALAAHPTQPRIAEVFATLQFNIGRDLDSSESLLLSGAVAKVTALARAYLNHRCTFTGSAPPWAPEGHEAEVNEVIVLPGVDRNAREKNALRPRLVRTCINVLINLACYRRAVSVQGEGGIPMEATSVDMIVACGGVPLLGEVLLAHINDSAVVTSVLNCAANIAFKNREVQLAIGESMTDAIVLSGWSFQRDTNLLSMALRAIGNLTNEDLNIYRGLGFGVVRMISEAMRANATNVPLQTLAASVLSNIASVEPLSDMSEAAEDVTMFQETLALRSGHPAMALRPSPEDVSFTGSLLSQGKNMWQVAPWLLVHEGAVACLTFASTKYAQDVNLVEACLRTLLCTCNEDDVTTELVLKHDLIGRVLFVMRACDFDVHVQASGAAILATAANISACAAAVTSTDAAHTLLMALDTNKGSLATALGAAAHAVANAAVADPASLLAVMDPVLDGKPQSVLQLLSRVCDVVGILAGPRASKAALELSSPSTLALLLTSAMTLLHTLASRGFSFVAPQATSRSLIDILGFAEAAATLLGEWLRHPSSRVGAPVGADGRPFVAADEEAACFAARSMVSQGGRAWPAVVRLLELSLAAPPGSASLDPRAATPLAATPKVVRALLSIPAAVIARAPVLPDRSALVKASMEAAGLPPGSCPSYPGAGNVLDVEGQGVDALAAAGAAHAVAALAVSLTAYVSAAMSHAAELYASRGNLVFDASAAAGRAAAGSAITTLDALGSVASPPQPVPVMVQDEASGRMVQVMQQPPASADALASALAGASSCSTLLASATSSLGGFLGKDVIPSPLKMTELADLAARAAAHTTARASAGGGAMAPLVPASEARAIYGFNLTRARQQAQVSGSASSASGAGAMPAPAMSAAVPGAYAAAAPALPGAAAAAGSAGGASLGGPKKSMRRANSSRRGLAGPLTSPEGVQATAWIDGKPQTVTLRVDAECKDLHLFPRPDKSGKLPAGLDPSSPMAIVPGGAYATVRIGKPMKDGKLIQRGGMFKMNVQKSDKSKTVCLDSAAGNTLVELETGTAGEADKLQAALEALAESAARAASKA